MKFLRAGLTISMAWLVLLSFVPAYGKTIDLSKVSEAPKVMVDLLQTLKDRELQLVGSSMEQLDPSLSPSPITCEFLSEGRGNKFYVFAPSKDGDFWRFATSLSDEFAIATVSVGPIGGLEWFGGLNLKYSSDRTSITTRSKTVEFNSDYSAMGVIAASFFGPFSTQLKYVFELSSNPDLSGTILKYTLTIKGGGVHYKRSCDYLVK